jgi:hypothetical protein
VVGWCEGGRHRPPTSQLGFHCTRSSHVQSRRSSPVRGFMTVALTLGRRHLRIFLCSSRCLRRSNSCRGRRTLRWCWSSNGLYSLKSAYNAFFEGRMLAVTLSQVWRSRAPYCCKFVTWIMSRDRCWTAHCLERRGLPRPTACPLCDQLPETLHHLLLGCVVALN